MADWSTYRPPTEGSRGNRDEPATEAVTVPPAAPSALLDQARRGQDLAFGLAGPIIIAIALIALAWCALRLLGDLSVQNGTAPRGVFTVETGGCNRRTCDLYGPWRAADGSRTIARAKLPRASALPGTTVETYAVPGRDEVYRLGSKPVWGDAVIAGVAVAALAYFVPSTIIRWRRMRRRAEIA